ncbi:hypothetical protein [Mucilaginibacter sp.]|uniref:hypothetical protein n=1 Tax=Mucilaginibacter sp. TaxID=1882438 RepID=UPI0032669920
MMKLSLRKTYCVIVITLIYIILVALSGMFKITHTPLNNFSKLINNFLIQGAYFMMMMYLASILKSIHEKKTIVTAVLIYTFFDAITFLLRTFLFGFSVIHGDMALNIITFVVTLYFILQTCSVKHTDFSFPFKAFGIIVLFSLIFRAIAATLFIMHWAGSNMLTFMVIAELLIPIPMLIIFYKTLRYLKKGGVLNDSTADTIELS